jgi:hypothetical protein
VASPCPALRHGWTYQSWLRSFAFMEDSSEEEGDESNCRRGRVRSYYNREAGCRDNGLPGAGLVQGDGRRDRDDQPRGASHESNRGNVPGELAVLDDELDCPCNGGPLLAGVVVGPASEDAGRDPLNGVVGAEPHRPDNKGGPADPGRRRGEAVEESPDSQEQKRCQYELSDVDDQPSVDNVRDSLVWAVSAGVRVEDDQYCPDKWPGVNEKAADACLRACFRVARTLSRHPRTDRPKAVAAFARPWPPPPCCASRYQRELRSARCRPSLNFPTIGYRRVTGRAGVGNDSCKGSAEIDGCAAETEIEEREGCWIDEDLGMTLEEVCPAG